MSIDLVSGREAYRETLLDLMVDDPAIYCLDTDTGLFAGADFRAAAPRYVNLGIAEQNLMSVAAGLAASGKRPFVNTMAAFAAARALEQVKVDIAYNRLPVRVAATHGGLSAGHLGPTHHELGDLAAMRLLPDMTIVVPADAAQTRAAVRQASRCPGPVYLRLGRKATPPIDAADELRIGRAQHLRPGDHAVVFACGAHPVRAALEAHEELRAAGVSAAVINLHTVKPLDREAVLAAARRRVVVTVEDHWASGGLGGAIAEVLSEAAPTRMKRIGVPDVFASEGGDHEWLLERFGITGRAVARAVRELLSDRERRAMP